MWILLAAMSAALLGFYDVFKKKSLQDNAVIPVLLINCAICSAIFMPMIIGSETGMIQPESRFFVPSAGWNGHLHVILKAFIVLSSWILGYYAIKHLPITIVGPVNATRPVMTLVGALLIFGEHLNLWQWAGVVIAIISFYMLSRSGKKEGISFSHDKWMLMLIASAVLGALSGLYDKYLMAGIGLDRFFVQGWYNFYQTIIMGVILIVAWYPFRKTSTPFKWKWTIPMISLFLSAADMAYFYALAKPGALIAVVSMVRRSSVLVSFIFGAIVFKEKNLRGKAFDLLLVLLSLVCLLAGTLL